MSLKIVLLVSLAVVLMSATTEGGFFKSPARIVHYHPAPVARYVYTRHFHHHEPLTRIVHYSSHPHVHYDHDHFHHHHAEEIIDEPHAHFF